MKKINFLAYRTACFVWVLASTAGLILLAVITAGIFSPFYRIAAATGFGLLAAELYGGYRWVYVPYRETERMFELFVDGFTSQEIYNLRFPLTYGMKSSLNKIKDMLDKSELIAANRRQAQYLALQNQINPHFLYNTLEGIRGEAITAGLDNVAKMTEALAIFFRYNISNMDQLVTLEDEIDNIQNYYTIQKYRFGERIHLSVICEEEDREWVYQCRIPKITLQPIVENAMVHGLERKLGKGDIYIRLTPTVQRLIINVSDNGIGIGEARLAELNKKLQTPFFIYESPEDHGSGGIALVNVNNRIQLLFGEEYGITVFSVPQIGTDVEIVLPLTTARDAERFSLVH